MSTKCEQLQDEVKDLQDDLTKLSELWETLWNNCVDEDKNIVVPESAAIEISLILGV